MQPLNRPAWRVAASLFLVVTFAALSLPLNAQEEPSDDPVREPVIVDSSIQAVWNMTDGQIANRSVERAWAFGPEPIAAAYEYYPQSPTKFRKVVYYDKGRLDMLNPQAPDGSIWMVSGALLATELLSGRIQLGESEFVSRRPAEIPLVGDFEQPNPVTYADLAKHSSLLSIEEPDDVESLRETSNRNLEQVGKLVTELLDADGKVIPGAVVDHQVTIVAYEELLGHNVASPFANWATDLEIPALNLLGLPVTEPYWIETEVDQVPVLVLIQAFERRTLTYTPTNAENWRVESGNVGLHYRLWRGLERPERPEFARMAAEIPFGEEILRAARDAYIDPYIFASIALNSTEGDPFSAPDHGGHGLLGARPDESYLDVNLNDPGVNAEIAAHQVATEMYAAWDWPTILTSFYLSGHEGAQQADAEAWASAVIATSERLVAHYPPTGPRIDPVRDVGKLIGEGRAAYYSETYDVPWWEGAMASHASWGNAVENWAPDPNGLYCVHPDYLVGERFKLEANGRVLECTIGDRVAVPHQLAWRAKWAVELSWPTFLALGLDRNNEVSVSYLGDRVIEPTPTPDESPTPDPDSQIPVPAQPDRGVPAPDIDTPGLNPVPTETPAPDLTPTESPDIDAPPIAPTEHDAEPPPAATDAAPTVEPTASNDDDAVATPSAPETAEPPAQTEAPDATSTATPEG